MQKGKLFMYHREFPFGRVFDTEGISAPKPPAGGGWTENRGELNLTEDEIVKAVVKETLKQQGYDRPLLDREHRKKFGEDPHGLATNKEVENVMSNRTPDGKDKITPPKSAHFQRRFRED